MESRLLPNDGASGSWDAAARMYHYSQIINRNTRNYWFRALRTRNAEVVMIIRRGNGKYLVHTKAFYPQESYRLMTGGLKPREEPNPAALREAYEETGLQVEILRDLARIDYEFQYEGETLYFTSYLVLLQELGGVLEVCDDAEEISGFREVTLDDLLLLADQLEALTGDAWADWGRFRAPAHRITYQLLVQNDATSR
ncbi:MAG: NUDIX hydrolase [Anaerolineae bacterium]